MSFSTTFLRRAQLEAERYGADPWVFIREFTQNARDAGATRVEIRMEASDQGTSLTFSDDGEGMSWNHAERYLFSLYASSKSDDGRTAGKFGVGFWSLLRIKPSEVIVCSCPRGGEGWRLRIDLGSTTAHRGPYHGPPGTQIHLRIPFPLSIVREAVEDTARQTVRYIRTLRGDAPLDVSVQGVSINAAFNLPSPSRTFALGNIRGVVALGRSPRVELFSRGIRVRAAGCLNDLLRDHPKLSYSRLQFSSLPGGLAPQVLLESDDLELELSRADVKNSKHLALAVRHARRHLERLVVEQLDTLAPPSLRERVREWLGDLPMIGWQRWRRPLSTVALFALSAVVVLNIPREAPDAGSSFRNTTPVATRAPTLPSPATRDESPRPYTDLRARYGGPSSHPEGLAASYHPIDLRYDPPDQPLHLAMLRIDRDPLTIPSFPPPEHPLPRATCEGGCITIALKIDAGVGFLPIPTPTGMGLIPSSLRVQEQKVPGRTLADHASMPMIELAEPTRGILTYSVGPLTRRARPAPLPPAPTLPIELAKAVEEAKTLPHDARVSRLREEVLARVRYDLAPEVAERHRARARLGDDLVTQLLDVGAGDCDLQNGLLTMLLQAAGVPARMAVGYLARDGTPHPFLHAWVEWRDAEGVWRVADASKSDVSANPPTTSRVERPRTYVAATTSPETSLEHPAPPPSTESYSGTPTPPLTSPAVLPTADPALSLRPTPIALIILILMSFAGAIAFLRARRSKEDAADPPAVLEFIRGMLSRPQILHDLPVLARRPLIRTLTGRRISIARCRALAASGRLFIANRRTPPAALGSQMREDILDDAYASSRLVATMMDGQDLEWWARILEKERRTPLVLSIEAALATTMRCDVVVIDEHPQGISVVDRRPLGFTRTGAVSVAIDVEHPAYTRADALYPLAPALATAILIEAIAPLLPSETHQLREITAHASRDALRELAEERPS